MHFTVSHFMFKAAVTFTAGEFSWGKSSHFNRNPSLHYWQLTFLVRKMWLHLKWACVMRWQYH